MVVNRCPICNVWLHTDCLREHCLLHHPGVHVKGCEWVHGNIILGKPQEMPLLASGVYGNSRPPLGDSRPPLGVELTTISCAVNKMAQTPT